MLIARLSRCMLRNTHSCWNMASVGFRRVVRSTQSAKIPQLFFTTRRFQSDLVLTEKRGKVFLVSINRPEKRNAVNLETAKLLANAFKSFEIDDETLVAVFHGKGGNFSSGYDLEEMSRFQAESYLKTIPPIGEGDGPMGPTRIKLSKPVIGAIEGHAVGGGLELALMCDMRIVEEDTLMGCLNRRFGVPQLDGGTVRLPYVIGLGRALDLIMTGRPVDAKEAQNIGLANRVVPKGKALETAVELADLISTYPMDSLIAERKSVYNAVFNAESFHGALEYEYRRGCKLKIVKDAIAGSKKFVNGAGRKGSFDDYL